MFGETPKFTTLFSFLWRIRKCRNWLLIIPSVPPTKSHIYHFLQLPLDVFLIFKILILTSSWAAVERENWSDMDMEDGGNMEPAWTSQTVSFKIIFHYLMVACLVVVVGEGVVWFTILYLLFDGCRVHRLVLISVGQTQQLLDSKRSFLS